MSTESAEQTAPPESEPAPDAASEDSAPDEPESTESAAESDPAADAEVRNWQAAYTTINGNVYANGSSWGFGGATGERHRVTGRIDVGELERALRYYVPPEQLSKARSVLERQHVVVLHGADGVGKHASALRLLRRVCPAGAELTSISPASSLAQLAESATFRAGRGYLVRDHVVDTRDAAARAHDLAALANQVRRSAAHLVLTTSANQLSERAAADYAVHLDSPDRSTLLACALEGVALPAGVRELAERAAAPLRTPHEIVLLAERLRADPERAQENLRDTAREQLDIWLARDLTRHDVFRVAVLALFGPLAEPDLDRLTGSLVAHAEASDDHEPAPYVAPAARLMPRRIREHDLITTDPDPDTDVDTAGGAGRRARFRRPEHRHLVLHELHESFGIELWRPLREWLHRRVDDLELSPRRSLELAQGLAQVARDDYPEVLTVFLEPWASGVIQQRLLAASLLWFMSSDDTLAPRALRTALGWGHNRGPELAKTSALALGGSLGLRFPAEAMRRLCFLALRGRTIATEARLSLSLLFASAVEQGDEATGELLRLVTQEHAWATDRAVRAAGGVADDTVVDALADGDSTDPTSGSDEPYEHAWTPRVQRAAREMVLTLLGATRPVDDEPLCALILREQPRHVAALGALWADLLCSAPHRERAITALRVILCSLEQHPSPRDAVAALGSSIHSGLPPQHRRLRWPELHRALHRERSARVPSPQLVAVLLAATPTRPFAPGESSRA